MEKELENSSLLAVLNKWKIHLLLIALVACILAFFFSSPIFITPKFKSKALVYPSNIAPYSNESMTEQMMEMMKSGFVKDSLVKSFNLFSKYNISSTSPNKRAILDNIYGERVIIERTDYEAIQISVLDEDPETAKKMVEKIIFYTDQLIKKLQAEKLEEVVLMNKQNLNTVKQKLDSVNIVVDQFRKDFSILDYNIQLEQVTKNYYKSLSGNGKGADEMRKMLETLKFKGSEYQFYNIRAQELTRFYAIQETEYLKSIRDFERSFTYTNVISKPMQPDQKSYPIRWVIVLSSILSALFLSMIVILNLEKKNILN